jgi:hypothetical protein
MTSRRSRLLGLVPSLLALPACLLINDKMIAITYDLEPQEFARDFGSSMGTVMSVDCSANAGLCSQLPAPSGTTAACDAATKKCVLMAEIELKQTINLSTQKDFPKEVANSSVISSVTVNSVNYWTATNTLTFDTPPIDLYVAPQTAQKVTDGGVVKLGTLPPLAAGKPTACRAGTPGTQQSSCTMPLTEAGKAALGTFAKNYATPFNILVVAHLTVQSGQAVPAGKLDLFVQPQLSFGIPFN